MEIDVAYERFLGPEMFFHPVCTIFEFFILTKYRNLFIKIGVHLLTKSLTMQYNHVQWITEEDCTRTLYCQGVALYSMDLIKNYKN